MYNSIYHLTIWACKLFFFCFINGVVELHGNLLNAFLCTIKGNKNRPFRAVSTYRMEFTVQASYYSVSAFLEASRLFSSSIKKTGIVPAFLNTVSVYAGSDSLLSGLRSFGRLLSLASSFTISAFSTSLAASLAAIASLIIFNVARPCRNMVRAAIALT